MAIARRLGVQVPPPFEVGISADFAATLEDPALRNVAMRSLRPAFGSGLVTGGLTAPSPDHPLSVDIRLAAAELVAFDVFVHNVDRRRGNPNVLVGRRSVVAIDHGEAFSFLLPIIGAPDPTDDPLLDVVSGHVFGASFGPRTGISLDRFRDAISALTDDALDAIRDATPAAWTVGLATSNLERTLSVIRARRDAVQRWLPQVQAWLMK